jgi:AraC-like DNA-binding protein
MSENFKKEKFISSYGYRINHTTGTFAKKSVIGKPHYSSEHMMYYFIKGSGNIKIEGMRYDINEGDIVILNPSELFHCTIDEGVYHERIVFHINETIINSFPCDCTALFDLFNKRKNGERNHISAETVRIYGCDKIINEIFTLLSSNEATKHVQVICKIVELLVHLNKAFEFYSKEEYVNPLINEVISYLISNLRKDISIASVASKFNISKSYLEHLFKEYVGTSLWSYVVFRRIHLVNNLLEKNFSAEEASRIAGFNNYSNFFRLYKKQMGMTPTEFKKTCIKK